MNTEEPQPGQQGSGDQLPGRDSAFEYVGSQPIAEADPELAVRGWIPLAEIFAALDQTMGKLFPPRRKLAKHP